MKTFTETILNLFLIDPENEAVSQFRVKWYDLIKTVLMSDKKLDSGIFTILFRGFGDNGYYDIDSLIVIGSIIDFSINQYPKSNHIRNYNTVLTVINLKKLTHYDFVMLYLVHFHHYPAWKKYHRYLTKNIIEPTSYIYEHSLNWVYFADCINHPIIIYFFIRLAIFKNHMKEIAILYMQNSFLKSHSKHPKKLLYQLSKFLNFNLTYDDFQKFHQKYKYAKKNKRDLMSEFAIKSHPVYSKIFHLCQNTFTGKFDLTCQDFENYYYLTFDWY